MALMEDPDEWIDEASRRGSLARRDAYRLRKGALERPPYDSAPEWAARWGEQAPPVGTVLRWTSVSTDEVRVALCVNDDEWSIAPLHDPATFVEVARFIGNAPCSVAIDWREIPTVEARPAGDAAVKDWAAQFIAPQASADA